MRRIAALALTAAVCACGPKPMGASEPTAPPADAPAPVPAVAPVAAGPDFSGDFDLVGTEPFWGLRIRADQLTLSRAGQDDLMAPNPGLRMDGDTAVWDATGPTVRLVVTLTPGDCSDGMSDRVYPATARVRFGGRALRGCAARPADLAAPPRP